MYDGKSYRFGRDQEFIYKIKGTEEFCLELYLRNPIEQEANKKAYSKLKEIIKRNFGKFGKDNETMVDVEKIKKMLLPKFKIITDNIATDVIKHCQSLIEFGYQYSKDNITEEKYK